MTRSYEVVAGWLSGARVEGRGDVIPFPGNKGLSLLGPALAASGRVRPYPAYDPGVRGLAPESWEFVAILSQLLGRKEAPAMTGSSHPKKKQSHLQKPRGVRRGLGKRRP